MNFNFNFKSKLIHLLAIVLWMDDAAVKITKTSVVFDQCKIQSLKATCSLLIMVNCLVRKKI